MTANLVASLEILVSNSSFRSSLLTFMTVRSTEGRSKTHISSQTKHIAVGLRPSS